MRVPQVIGSALQEAVVEFDFYLAFLATHDGFGLRLRRGLIHVTFADRKRKEE
jgi:hypothetical protein